MAWALLLFEGLPLPYLDCGPELSLRPHHVCLSVHELNDSNKSLILKDNLPQCCLEPEAILFAGHFELGHCICCFFIPKAKRKTEYVQALNSEIGLHLWSSLSI